MQITVQVRQVYGNETVYPACPLAAKFAALAGTKTLTADALRIIDAMGVAIVIETPRISKGF